MCYFFELTHNASQIAMRFKAKFKDENAFHPSEYKGFEYPMTPVITNEDPQEIDLFHWGLVPYWAKPENIRKYTINARIETIAQKPAFKEYIHNRCIILADGFYEWQWLDPKGIHKQKYHLAAQDRSLFAFAGLWNIWNDPVSGKTYPSYTLLTMEANPMMSIIHNVNKRMPVILQPGSEKEWLKGENLIPGDAIIIAEKI